MQIELKMYEATQPRERITKATSKSLPNQTT